MLYYSSRLLWTISSTDRVALSEGVDRGSIPRWFTKGKPQDFNIPAVFTLFFLTFSVIFNR